LSNIYPYYVKKCNNQPSLFFYERETLFLINFLRTCDSRVTYIYNAPFVI